LKDANAILSTAKETILLESNAIANLANLLNSSFTDAVNFIFNSKGRVIVTGIEKSAKIDELTAADIMSITPKTIDVDAMAVEALDTLENNNITQILVTNENNNYVSVVHLHDLIKEGIF
jgi:CBS domain-containing protein